MVLVERCGFGWYPTQFAIAGVNLEGVVADAHLTLSNLSSGDLTEDCE